jgi:hypothetical protein
MSFITAGASSMNALYNTDSSGLFGIGGIAGNLLGRRRREAARKRKEARSMSTAAGANNQIESRLSAVEGALEELNTATSEPVVDTPSEAPVPQVSAGATNNLKALGTIEGVFGGPEQRDITRAQVMAEPVAPPTVQESLQDQLGKTILGIQ